jgi:hypothetical protein
VGDVGLAALIFSVIFVDEVSKGVAYGAAIVGGGALIVVLFLVSVDLYQGRRKIVETQLGSQLNTVLLRGPGGTAPTVKARVTATEVLCDFPKDVSRSSLKLSSCLFGRSCLLASS